MAIPSTANMAAPTLARSQKVELFRSAWLTCLQDGERRTVKPQTHRGQRLRNRCRDRVGRLYERDMEMKEASD